MPGDYSRSSFDPRNHYTSIRLQQGRVQMDADFNELADILQHRVGTQITDFIGRSGAPRGQEGFVIASTPDGGLTIGRADGRGRYYVDGLLCECDGQYELRDQPDLPHHQRERALLDREIVDDRGAALDSQPRAFLVYLEVWEREITAAEAPQLADPALLGADTATRTRNVCQVRLRRISASLETHSTAEVVRFATAVLPNENDLERPLLQPSVRQAGTPLENQLYRVEIHRSGNREQASWKWSRDNASITCRGVLDGDRVVVDRWSPGSESQLFPGDWIEVRDEFRMLHRLPGSLVQVSDVANDHLLGSELQAKLERDQTAADLPPFHGPVTVLKWDGVGAGTRPETVGFSVKGSHVLEHGLEVEFPNAASATFRSGDFWLIPSRQIGNALLLARNSDGTYASLAAHGVRCHYGPLAVADWNGNEFQIIDMLPRFSALAEGLLSKTGDRMEGPLEVRDDLTLSGSLIMTRPNNERVFEVSVGQSDSHQTPVDLGKPFLSYLLFGVRGYPYSSDGKRTIALKGTQSAVQADIYDLESGGRVVRRLPENHVFAIDRFAPDDTPLAVVAIIDSGDVAKYQLWDLDATQPIGPGISLGDKDGPMALSPDGSTLVWLEQFKRVNAEGKEEKRAAFRFVNGRTGEVLSSQFADFEGGFGLFGMSAMFSPDGSLLVTPTENSARVWDVPSGVLKCEIPRTSVMPATVAISTDNRLLAVVDGPGIVKVASLPDGAEVARLNIPVNDIGGSGKDEGGRWLQFVDGDRRLMVNLRFWDTQTWREESPILPGLKGLAWGASPDGERMSIISGSGQAARLHVWQQTRVNVTEMLTHGISKFRGPLQVSGMGTFEQGLNVNGDQGFSVLNGPAFLDGGVGVGADQQVIRRIVAGQVSGRGTLSGLQRLETERVDTGSYLLKAEWISRECLVQVSSDDHGGRVTAGPPSTGKVEVFTFNDNGTQVDKGFQFIIFDFIDLK